MTPKCFVLGSATFGPKGFLLDFLTLQNMFAVHKNPIKFHRHFETFNEMTYNTLQVEDIGFFSCLLILISALLGGGGAGGLSDTTNLLVL